MLNSVFASFNRALGVTGFQVSRVGIPSQALSAEAKASLSDRFKNYHLGCGPLVVDGFLNIDSYVKQYTQKVGTPVLLGDSQSAYVMGYDLRHGVPAADSTLKTIYHSHFLEHLTNKEGIAFLRDCYRCLAGGSVMRFAVPDFELWCKNYMLGNNGFFDWYEDNYLGSWWESNHERALVFSGMLFNFGHKMAYDFASLSSRLAGIGFVDISRSEWGRSNTVENVSMLEKPSAPRAIESLVVECLKPRTTLDNQVC